MLYSLKNLSAIFNSKHTLTRDRFLHYFTLRYNYSEKQASEAHRLYSQFPKGIYNEKESEILDKVIPKALELYDELSEGWEKKRLLKIQYDEKLIKKLVFKKDGEVKKVIFDFYEPTDIITYAELLKNKEVEMVALLSLSCELYGKHTPLVFVGDIFDTNDKFWGDKSDVYVAQEKGSFKRLLYIKGKGYITGRDKLNYELDKTYSSYVLKLEEYEKIGNVLIDYSVLTEG
jgi:hypothetical protein